jgi:DNA invertase Pin-like site-specific DNA recombinase
MEIEKACKHYKAAIYIRLSKDDGDKAESNSVSNQRDLILSYLKSKPEIGVCSERIDDGYSGVSFDRPGIKELLSDIKAGTIDCVVVKDLSRFGRNYIETGRYIEQVFPFLGVRFIAINDGFDSATIQSQSDGIIIPFKNLINDAYSRDISMKVRSQIKVRHIRGEYIGSFPVYGYVRSKENKHKLEIDEFAAMTVRDIFKWKTEGYSNQRIAQLLNAAGILSPLEYKRMLGWAFSTSFKLKPMAKWSAQSVGRILENEIYTGTMVQGKESAPNYKVKKKFKKPKSEWAIVKNTHEPIITKEDFNLVSRIISADTRTAPMQQELYPFAGILKCSECHKSMIRRPVKSNGKTYIYYTCRTNKEDKEKCKNSNRISEHQLLACVKEVMKVHIGAISKTNDILSYIETLPREQLQIKKYNQRIQKKREEYDYYQNLIMGLYEDFKKDILNKENYLNMKSNYETIIGDISDSIDIMERDISELLQKKDLTNQWIWEYRKNHNISNLNRSILLSMVREIVVYDKNNIQIHFNYFDETLNKKDNISHGQIK